MTTSPTAIPEEWIKKCGDALIADITDRRGLRQEFDNCDEETQTEIRDTLGEIAITVLRPLIEAETRERCAQIAEHPLGLRTTIMPHPLLGAGAKRCVTWIVEHIRDEASSALRAEGE